MAVKNEKKINDFCRELAVLMKQYNVTLGVDIDGDTHGVSASFVVTDEDDRSDHVIVPYSSYLDLADLKDYFNGG